MRDVYRPWPGALRDSNWRRDRRTSCARSINFIPTPLSGDDPRSAGGRRRQYFLAPTPGAQTSASGGEWLPKHPPRGFLATDANRYVVAGGRSRTPNTREGEIAGPADPGSLYNTIANPQLIGDLAGEVTTNAANPAWPPLAQMAWGGPQIGIVAVAANGKLAYYDERVAEKNAADGESNTTWFPDVLGNSLDSDVIGVQFFQNYCFILDDRNRLFASPLLARNTTAQGSLEPDTPDGMGGPIRRYEFDLTQLLQRSLEPDPWVAMLALSDRLLLFGRQTLGTWTLKPDPEDGFPLQRDVSGQYEAGAASAGAIAAVGDRAYWVGRSSRMKQ